jgi:hypothetical protein
MIHHLASAVMHHCSVVASMVQKGIREIHEDDDDHDARNGEGHVVKKEATPKVAAGAERLTRTWGV